MELGSGSERQKIVAPGAVEPEAEVRIRVVVVPSASGQEDSGELPTLPGVNTGVLPTPPSSGNKVRVSKVANGGGVPMLLVGSPICVGVAANWMGVIEARAAGVAVFGAVIDVAVIAWAMSVDSRVGDGAGLRVFETSNSKPPTQ